MGRSRTFQNCCVFRRTSIGNDITIKEGDWISIEENEYDTANLRSSVSGKWGQYTFNKKLFYQETDSELEEIIGLVDEEINLEFSETVSTNTEAVVQDKVRKLLIRTKNSKHIVTLTLDMRYVRAEINDTSTY